MVHANLAVTGGDISLNHGAFVQLNRDGAMSRWNWIGSKQVGGKGLIVPKKSNDEQPLAFSLRRLDWWDDLLRLSLRTWESEYIAIEDYAFHGDMRPHATGELGGIARRAAVKTGAGLRMIDPTSVKLFATGQGNAKKPAVIAAVSREVDFENLLGHKLKEETLGDLCDAYTIARMLWTEVMLREAVISLSSLPEHQIRVFNRVTKANPVNVLACDFIYQRKEAPWQSA